MQRAIQRRKFHATLPQKLDKAEQDWHATQPPMTPPPVRLDDLHIRAPWYEPDDTSPTD